MCEPVETLSGDPSIELPEFDAPPDEPLLLLESWLQAADARGVREPRALALGKKLPVHLILTFVDVCFRRWLDVGRRSRWARG